jgi:DNA polymerase III alpha subunit/intein/homing endonuclease
MPNIVGLIMQFSHLHCHTQYSLLDGAANISAMFQKAEKDNMPAVAITDHGNMFGVFQFVAEAAKVKDVKPIVGCEFYVVENRFEKVFTKDRKDKRVHQLFLAKNANGYRNLTKMCSLGFIEGMYSKYPRIDKALILQYHQDLIATTCCIGASVPQMILNKGEAEARKEFEWWLDIFGEDYYIELQRHRIPDQEKVNEVLLRFADEYHVKVIASNDSHYVDRKDANAHDILLCLNTGEKQSTPKMDDYSDDGGSQRGKRFAFANDEFFFKTTAEMTTLFKDIPQAIDNTNEIVAKIEPLKLKQDIMLPNFVIPTEFANQDDYLRHLTYEGAKERYRDLTPEVEERLNFELFTVKTMGFAGYFLIVADFIKAGRDLGVFIGPGRGCLTADVPVVMSNGETKPLASVEIGDAVWTQDGSLRQVTNRFEYDTNETLLNIKTYYGEETGVTLTKDHKVLVEKMQRPKNYDNWAKSTQKARKMPDPTGELTWLPASDLAVGDWVFVPTPQALPTPTPYKTVTPRPAAQETMNVGQNKRIDFAEFSNDLDLRHDEKFAYHDVLNPLVKGIQKTKQISRYLDIDADWFKIMGIFAGDGWWRKDYRPEISVVFHQKDTELITFFKNKMMASGFEMSERAYGKTVQIHVRNKHLYLWFKQLFHRYEADAHSKHVPDCVLNGTDEQILAFLQGYLAADGHESKHKIKFTTVSRLLADQVRFICWKVGIPASLSTDKRIGDTRPMFQNRTTAYMVSIPKDARIGAAAAEDVYMYRQVKGGFLFKIREISEVENVKKVYDIEVEQNHNYLTSSFLVHNSAAGSAVAYCIGITNIDPIKYKLLFERFLNPDRKSMPDIDTDFDDEGRQKVIDYVVDKYGKQQVAQIVTYGTMAAKMSIKDVARVMDLPLQEANAMVKLVSDRPGIKLKRLLTAPLTGEGSLTEKDGLGGEDLENAKLLREILAGNDERSKVLKEALVLEGSVRGTGVHAAGIIIAPCDLTDIIPVATAKDSDLLLTQYEGTVIEDAGVIKMDFLGLKTLTIMRDALRLIKQNYGRAIEIDNIPLDDPKTYELYQKGETNATFQFESPGMQKHLRDLKPTRFDDLIAMNALYRPGPLEYIPNFIRRKNGQEKIAYDLPVMEEYLSETYGITVYQEQLMLLSQKLANFSKGDADVLRKAMGKKQIAVLQKMKPQFMEGCAKNGHPAPICEKIWTDWEAFASYAFNKSHSTCYAFVAYQTAYLKAHYPAEYMAAVLSNNQSNIEKITFFMEECKRMGVMVKGPDVNESDVRFSVNKKSDVRFALSAVKGVGDAAVEQLIEERQKNGAYTSFFDFIRRLSSKQVNKRVLESLAYAGAFDSFGYTRATFFAPSDKFETFIEHATRFGASYQAQKSSAETSLFGGTADVNITDPVAPKTDEWNLIQKLNHEKDVVGIYLSGHPLDDFRLEMSHANVTLDRIGNYRNQKVKIAAFVAAASQRVSKKGTYFGNFTLQDYNGMYEFALFTEDYARFAPILQPGVSVFIEGEMKQRYNSEEQELKIREVRQLASIGATMTESITLMIPIETITTELMQSLEQLFDAHKGKHRLKMVLQDGINRMTLPLYSLDCKVNVDSDFVGLLQARGVAYKVN